MSGKTKYGGMELPGVIRSCINEILGSGCLSLSLNPLMTQGQIEALENHASTELKNLYLPNLISGRWCGTMNLTEENAEKGDSDTDSIMCYNSQNSECY